MHRYDPALANLEKAIALAPDNADVNATFGHVLNFWGSPKQALEMIEKAFSIDTVVPPNWEYQLGLSHLLLRQYDNAIAGFNRAIERAPKFIPAQFMLACAYVELNRLDDARNAIKTLSEVAPQLTVKEFARILPVRIDEVSNHIFDTLRTAGMAEG